MYLYELPSVAPWQTGLHSLWNLSTTGPVRGATAGICAVLALLGVVGASRLRQRVKSAKESAALTEKRDALFPDLLETERRIAAAKKQGQDRPPKTKPRERNSWHRWSPFTASWPNRARSS